MAYTVELSHYSGPNGCKLPSQMQYAGRGLFDQEHSVNASTRLPILLVAQLTPRGEVRLLYSTHFAGQA